MLFSGANRTMLWPSSLVSNRPNGAIMNWTSLDLIPRIDKARLRISSLSQVESIVRYLVITLTTFVIATTFLRRAEKLAHRGSHEVLLSCDPVEVTVLETVSRPDVGKGLLTFVACASPSPR